MTGHTKSLASFISECSIETIPVDVRNRALTMIKDGSAALLAAANPRYSTGQTIAEHVRSLGGEPQAGVVGHGFRTNAVQAALANGTMGYACDIEPHHPEAILHPIAVMIPTALALCELSGGSGDDFITAIILGCEVEYRVSMAIGPAEQYALGFHPSAVCGTFGATAAAASILNLDPETTERALGLAGCEASGLMAWESDPTENARPFQMGLAARNGVTAALLARDGFGGPAEIFDRAHSPLNAFSRNPTAERLTHQIGETWDGLMELAIKPYPCVAFLHPGLDALLELVDENDISADDVETLTIRFPKSGIHCIEDNPLKSHSAPYVLPVTLARRQLEIDDLFFDARNDDPKIAELCKKVEVVADEAELESLFPDFYATEIVVRLADGRTLSRRKDIARGYPETPMGQSNLADKFERLVGSVDIDRVTPLYQAIDNLPGAKNIETFAALMTKSVET
ncbi:MAG: MmgE/PrpD family protein [Pseudomonadota bacterium]|nr:MmgE/PrpD family protein [Pseudomonadota bacterium]MED5359932.1 MmgE/PrpD family protein [Pseudomonadota bacterium]